jgi:hypothetical protein
MRQIHERGLGDPSLFEVEVQRNGKRLYYH